MCGSGSELDGKRRLRGGIGIGCWYAQLILVSLGAGEIEWGGEWAISQWPHYRQKFAAE